MIKQIKFVQVDDKELAEFMKKSTDIKLDDLGVARFRSRLCALKDENLRKSML